MGCGVWGWFGFGVGVSVSGGGGGGGSVSVDVGVCVSVSVGVGVGVGGESVDAGASVASDCVGETAGSEPVQPAVRTITTVTNTQRRRAVISSYLTRYLSICAILVAGGLSDGVSGDSGAIRR